MKYNRKKFFDGSTREVCPILSFADRSHTLLGNPVDTTDRSQTFTAFQTVNHINRLIFGQLASVYSTAASLYVWIVERFILPTFSPLVSLVVARRSQEKVIGINARRVVARVANLIIEWRGAEMQTKCYPRSSESLTSEFKSAVPVLIAEAEPKPTLTGLVDLALETLFFVILKERNGQVFHNAILSRNPYKQEVFA